MTKRVAIIGGGITGLSCAYYLLQRTAESGDGLRITLIEAEDRLGGKVKTLRRDGFVIERGPDSILKRKPEGLELVEQLGLGADVVTNRTGRSYILKDDALHPIPDGSVMGVPTSLRPLLQSGLLSMDGKARALNDLFIPKLGDFDDLSVGEFFRKRLGDEMVDHLIGPLLSGIYAGDIDQLSLEAALPQFINIEKRYGSLILGLRETMPKRGKSEGQFATLTTGLNAVIDALADALDSEAVSIMTGVEAESFEKDDNGYYIGLSDGTAVEADYVVFAVPHRVAERLIGADFLRRDRVAPDTSVATIAMAFAREDVEMSKDGTGFVVSRREPKAITASTWTHLKWPHTAPEGKALIRCYVGKPNDPGIIEKTDDELVAIAIKEMSGTVAIKGEPDFAVVTRWPLAMPQYPVGHKRWLAEVTARLARDFPNVYLAGASYDGVGIPDCIRQARSAAQNITAS